MAEEKQYQLLNFDFISAGGAEGTICKSLSVMLAVVTEQFSSCTQQMRMLLELQHLEHHTKLMESFVLSKDCLNFINLVPSHSEIYRKSATGLVLTLEEAAFHIWFNTLEKIRGQEK